jgi:hypothetical protein
LPPSDPSRPQHHSAADQRDAARCDTPDPNSSKGVTATNSAAAMIRAIRPECTALPARRPGLRRPVVSLAVVQRNLLRGSDPGYCAAFGGRWPSPGTQRALKPASAGARRELGWPGSRARCYVWPSVNAGVLRPASWNDRRRPLESRQILVATVWERNSPAGFLVSGLIDPDKRGTNQYSDCLIQRRRPGIGKAASRRPVSNAFRGGPLTTSVRPRQRAPDGGLPPKPEPIGVRLSAPWRLRPRWQKQRD